MADDMFGDSSLFEEFEREREPSGSFIFYEKGEAGDDDKSRIYIQADDSSSSSEDEEDESGEEVKVREQKKSRQENGDLDNESSSENEEPQPFISKERAEKSTSFKLNYERNKFKRYCNIIDSTRFIHDEQTPVIQMIFQNNPFARRHRTRIEGFIKFLLLEDSRSQHQTMQKVDLLGSAPSCSDINDKIPVSKRTDKMWQSHAILGCSQVYEDFIVDTLGWPLVEYNPSLTDSWDIPPYEQVYKEALPVEKPKPKSSGPSSRPKNTCWNCGGDHMLIDCKEPRNQQKINERRNAMQQEKQSQQSLQRQGSGRYHKDTTVDPRFQKFKPGVISDDLRSALGLNDCQLPFYIYKMRALGYPPGWMMEAMDSTEPELAMFGKDGNELDKDGEPLEDGEMGVADQPPPQRQLNPDKIIEYPGFSALPPEGAVDEAQFYGLPPLQPHQLKSTLLAHNEMQKLQERETQKRKMEDEAKMLKKQKLETSALDMDLDDDPASDPDISFHPPLPAETPPSKPPLPKGTPPPTPDSPTFQHPAAVAGKRASRQSSGTRMLEESSLEDLEAQYQSLQKKLLAEEDDEDVIVIDSIDESDIDNHEDSVIVIDSQDSMDESGTSPRPLPRVGSAASINTFGELGIGSPLNSQPSSPRVEGNVSFKANTSLSKDYGTPVLTRTKGVKELPDTKNFSVGIEDHIPFENLPESTGTFNKMRKLIDKIREQMPLKKKKK